MLPVIHGSGDFAVEVRRRLLDESHDCLAVPLPASFKEPVFAGIRRLPTPGIVVQRAMPAFLQSFDPENLWSPDQEVDDVDGEDHPASYVPIDPCQPVIAALRASIGESLAVEFIDLETDDFIPETQTLPDPYALKRVSLERFAAASLPAITPPVSEQRQQRMETMAARLRRLEKYYKKILFLCNLLDWPWIREAYQKSASTADPYENESTAEPQLYGLDPATLVFMLGELPFITARYEDARLFLEDDANMAIDGVKELCLAARDTYYAEFKQRSRKLTPQLLGQLLKYIRNLSLLDRRFTPDMYTIVVAAKQVAGDQYARHVAERIREYLPAQVADHNLEKVRMTVDRAEMPDGDILEVVSRLPAHQGVWRSLNLKEKATPKQSDQWKQQWNPFMQCSWPPEDKLIEDFRTHVADAANQIIGADLARTEKFTTSVKDGIDIRDTLRHWYAKEIYVKVMPPVIGDLDAVVILFDSPADPREYVWRTTWYAEHQNESTLAFFATNYQQEMVGPGIALATYGGCLFLFPPKRIRDIWTDKRLDYVETLEERVLAAACMNASCPNIALVSPGPPGAAWRRLAKRYKKKWVHIPLSRFSDATINQLRQVHVLNGHQVRSYAADFIRRA